MRLINADELKKILSEEITRKFVRWDKTITVAEWETFIQDIIDNAPTVDMDERDTDAFETGYIKGICEQRPQGEWKGNGIERICSECGFDVPVSKYELCNFCPNCGAQMKTRTETD